MAAIVLILAGAAFVIGGTAALSIPAAVIVAGTLCLVAGVDLVRPDRGGT